VGECFFWYRPTRVVPEKRPLNGRCCCCTEEEAEPTMTATVGDISTKNCETADSGVQNRKSLTSLVKVDKPFAVILIVQKNGKTKIWV